MYRLILCMQEVCGKDKPLPALDSTSCSIRHEDKVTEEIVLVAS